MLFNSYIFLLLFLPLTVIGYYLLNRGRKYQLALCFLTAMSLWFYSYLNISYLPLLLISVGVTYLLTTGLLCIAKTWIRRLLFVLGISFHLGSLFYYKYYNFFAENMNQAFQSELTLIRVVLPLGISFLAFRQLAYLIDAYRGKLPKYSFLSYVSYITFFPLLSQGPIVLHEDLIPQMMDEKKKNPDYSNLLKGCYAFILGLAKKVLIADTLATFVTLGFGGDAGTDTINTMVAMLSYALQLYFDFSGYCDMAHGIALLFNLELPPNFFSPYKATSIADFWNRWHITLSTFFTRYVYIPLGGNRKGVLRMYTNTMIIFLLSGLWHGANWTFLLWGILNGVFVVADKMGKKFLEKIPKGIKIVATFIVSVFLWTIFRAETVPQAFTMMKQIVAFGIEPLSPVYIEAMNNLIEIRILARLGLSGVLERLPYLPTVFMLFIPLCSVFFLKNTLEKIKEFKPKTGTLLWMILLFTWSVLSLSQVSTFLYINF